MKAVKPQPQLLSIWRILAAVAAAPVAFLISFLLPTGSGWWLGLSAGWVLGFLFCFLYYFPARYRSCYFSLSEGMVLAHVGVFVQKKTAIPLGSVRFTTIVQTPIERIFRLCTLRVAAPGGNLLLPGLREQDALALAEILSGGGS